VNLALAILKIMGIILLVLSTLCISAALLAGSYILESATVLRFRYEITGAGTPGASNLRPTQPEVDRD
jgi:hypothetical protein